MTKFLMLIALLLASLSSNAAINIFTDHQIVYMTQHGVNQGQDVQFKTGDYPYLGRIGLEYERNKWSYQLAYIHRSNVDISGDEYNYNGVSLGIKYAHCFAYCK